MKVSAYKRTMAGFVKLFSSLLESTVWMGQPAHVKLAWITLLAKSDANGVVTTPVPVLATLAGLTLQDFENALEVFLAPDPYSRSREHEGRRIERLPDNAKFSGFRILNYMKYRSDRETEIRREQNRQAQRRRREKLTRGDSQQSQPRQPKSAQAEAEAEAEADQHPPNPPPGGTVSAHDLPHARSLARIFKTGPEMWAGFTRQQSKRLADCGANVPKLETEFRLWHTGKSTKAENPDGWEALAEMWVLRREEEAGQSPHADADRVKIQLRMEKALSGSLGKAVYELAVKHVDDPEAFRREERRLRAKTG